MNLFLHLRLLIETLFPIVLFVNYYTSTFLFSDLVWLIRVYLIGKDTFWNQVSRFHFYFISFLFIIILKSSPKDIFSLLWERQREKHQCEKKSSICWHLCIPLPGTESTTQVCALTRKSKLGIKPATFWPTTWCSNQLSCTSWMTRANISFFKVFESGVVKK